VAQCRATKTNGEPCTTSAVGSTGFCWAHDPAYREQRRRIASKGGRSRGGSATRDVEATRDLLQEIASEVLGGGVDRSDAAVAIQALNAKLKALELLRKWKEADELQERLAALERDAFGGSA
jgi:hypothetical protein